MLAMADVLQLGREWVAFNWEKLENNFLEDVLFGQHRMQVRNWQMLVEENLSQGGNIE